MDKKVVVVDDDLKVIMMLEQGISQMGLSVFSAKDGQKGLDLIRREKPDIVVTDLLMPGIHGAELCKAVKADPELAHAKVIFISGVYNEASFKLAMDCKGDGFLEKPIDMERLSKIITQKLAEPIDA